MLEESLAEAQRESLVMSKGIVGSGISYFEQVCAQNLEGIVAKRLNSPYLPGKRTDAWQKIKRQQNLICAIVGYVAEGEADLGSIILAAEVEGVLRYVGKVGSGMTEVERVELVRKLIKFRRSKPIVACRAAEAVWVEPELFCTVRFMEWTRDRHLRHRCMEGCMKLCTASEPADLKSHIRGRYVAYTGDFATLSRARFIQVVEECGTLQ